MPGASLPEPFLAETPGSVLKRSAGSPRGALCPAAALVAMLASPPAVWAIDVSGPGRVPEPSNNATPPVAAPTVTTPTSSLVTSSTATLGAHVTLDGGSVILERGVVYSQTAINDDPLIGGFGVTKVTVVRTTGLFAAGVTGLPPATGHSFRAFATNALGTSYTSVATFTTACPSITLGSLPNGDLTAPYTGSAAAAGGTGPYTYAVTSGALPDGLSLTASGAGAGSLAGTPTTTGIFAFNITATDTSGAGTCSGVQSYSEVISPEPGQDFFTLAPCRVLDTRNATGPLGGPALIALADRTFAVAGVCGIPADAKAISLNLAVTQPTHPGNIRLHPGATPVPLVSSINHKAGQTRSNNGIIPLSALGELAAYLDQAAGSAHLVLDVNGYFGVNHAPVATDDTATTPEDTAATIPAAALTANDIDVEGSLLSITAVSGATNGTVGLVGATITFTPAADFNGTAGFDYTVSDGVLSAVGHVTVTVTPVNDPPVAVDDFVTTAEDTVAMISAASLLANDIDLDSALTIIAVGNATNGTVVLVGATITFTPAATFNGTAGFDYTVSDGVLSSVGHVTVVVTPAPTSPAPPDSTTRSPTVHAAPATPWSRSPRSTNLRTGR